MPCISDAPKHPYGAPRNRCYRLSQQLIPLFIGGLTGRDRLTLFTDVEDMIQISFETSPGLGDALGDLLKYLRHLVASVFDL